MGYYLLLKKCAGYKYLCKCRDNKNPALYKGSGVFWRRIIKKHESEIETVVLGHYNTAKELREAGEYYSELWNIVGDKTFANLIPEIGDGGATVKSKIRAYNVETNEERFFNKEDGLPKGWARGAKRPQKTNEQVERTRQFHLGRKRSEETKNRMRNAIRRKRTTIKCELCNRQITPQNIKRHRKLTHEV